LAALGEVFEAARGIMSWLGDCAKVALLSLYVWFQMMLLALMHVFI